MVNEFIFINFTGIPGIDGIGGMGGEEVANGRNYYIKIRYVNNFMQTNEGIFNQLMNENNEDELN